MAKLKNIVTAAATAVSLTAGWCGGALADEERKFAYSWTVTAASDYIFRGISYTGNDATVNSYLEFTYGIAYLGLWTSNIDTCDGPGCLGPWEQDLYVGIRPVTGPISWDIGALYYTYRTKGTGFSWTDTDYVDLKLAATMTPVTNLTLGATVYYQPEQGFAATSSLSLEGSAAYTLPAVGMFTPTLSGGIGYSNSSTSATYPTGYWLGDDEYFYWNAGLKLAVEKFTFDFRYWDTNLEPVGFANNLADSRFLFTTAVTLAP